MDVSRPLFMFHSFFMFGIRAFVLFYGRVKSLFPEAIAVLWYRVQIQMLSRVLVSAHRVFRTLEEPYHNITIIHAVELLLYEWMNGLIAYCSSVRCNSGDKLQVTVQNGVANLDCFIHFPRLRSRLRV